MMTAIWIGATLIVTGLFGKWYDRWSQQQVTVRSRYEYRRSEKAARRFR